ncbi:Bro-N domain-containing protein [Desulfobaculum bizertense]|uniref:BRO-N domain-containing protein n=1 Tax=Desulfobaculum bizertense TaxID=376490 RepID=UPI001F27B837|nr:Bro-N domain-containing protein [Desulfobaculum bizertense]UIJ36878.1 Bro-N domain-containing protein [Desulfobaculum bizertense]
MKKRFTPQASETLPFDFHGNAVRVVLHGGIPWFIAKDVCRILEIENSRDAVSRLDDDEKDGVNLPDAIGRIQTMTCISESGLYLLIFSSRKPRAKRFRRWVTSEVLPSIREIGEYRLKKSKEEVPRRFRSIRPSVRAQLLNNAVQAVKLNGADYKDIKTMFLEFCDLVAPQSWEDTSPALGQEEDHTGPMTTESLFSRWATASIVHAEGQGISVSQSYTSFKLWFNKRYQGKVPRLSEFGEWMKDNFHYSRSDTPQFKGIMLQDPGRKPRYKK